MAWNRALRVTRKLGPGFKLMSAGSALGLAYGLGPRPVPALVTNGLFTKCCPRRDHEFEPVMNSSDNLLRSFPD